jgi:hypothetical protein
MSMEIHVFFRGKLPSKPALAKAMKEFGFPITIPPPKDSLEKQSGFLPMRLRREEAGAEFDVFEGRANIADIMGHSVSEVDPGFDRCGSFRFGGNENEMITAICASAALAKLVGGVVLECESGELMQVDAAIAWAKEILDDWIKARDVEAAKPKSQRTPGTTPADLKRYLKPLLEKRDDLVLVGRLLLIRPVRHLIRGAYFEPRGKYHFQIWNHVNPLYAPAGERFGDSMILSHVWEPHFEPLLIDVLKEDVFATLGRITTLTDFADFSPSILERTAISSAKVMSLALAGERNRAAEYVAHIQNDDTLNGYAKKVVREAWERVSSNIEAVCDEFHAKEAATIKALKLEHLWEPSPFPVELSGAERARVSEPAFSITPWIGRPGWLVGEMPDEPGEVRFGKDIRRRNERDLFEVPLSREEAEKRHHASETYAMAERRADGDLLMVMRTGKDLNDPERSQNMDYGPFTDLHITWKNPSYLLRINPSRDFDDRSMIGWWSLSVWDRVIQKELWLGYVNLRQNKTTTYDWRSGEQVFSDRQVATAERDIARCPVPAFAEYAELLARAQSLLEILGYGSWPGGSQGP